MQSIKHIFISPHMDDVVFSTTDYIYSLQQKNIKVKIATIFTNFGNKPISLDAKKYIWKSGFLSLKKFQILRKKEDYAAMKKLGIDNYIHLNFTDAGFRKRKKSSFSSGVLSCFGIGNKFIYPYHSEKSLYSKSIAKEDYKLIKRVYREMKKIITKDDILYSPLSYGNNVDHIICKKVVEMFKNKKYYWLDQPYAKKNTKLRYRNYITTKKIKCTRRKINVTKCYKSQIRCMFPKHIKYIDEQIYEKI